MERILLVFLLLTIVAFGSVLAKPPHTIDMSTNSNDFSSDEKVAQVDQDAPGKPANLSLLYVTWDSSFLYIGVDFAPDGWGLALGIAFDINKDPNIGFGAVYEPDDSTWRDCWGRFFNHTSPYYPDYISYFWYDGSTITTAQFNRYMWESYPPIVRDPDVHHWYVWYYNDLVSVGGGYTPVASDHSGSTLFKVKVPWSALGGVPSEINLVVYITGGDGSAVSSIPYNDNVHDQANEWSDHDNITTYLRIDIAKYNVTLKDALGKRLYGHQLLANGFSATTDMKGVGILPLVPGESYVIEVVSPDIGKVYETSISSADDVEDEITIANYAFRPFDSPYTTITNGTIVQASYDADKGVFIISIDAPAGTASETKITSNDRPYTVEVDGVLIPYTLSKDKYLTATSNVWYYDKYEKILYIKVFHSSIKDIKIVFPLPPVIGGEAYLVNKIELLKTLIMENAAVIIVSVAVILAAILIRKK